MVPEQCYILTELIVLIVPKDTIALTRTTSMRYLHQLDHGKEYYAVKDFFSLSLPSFCAGCVLGDTIVAMAPLNLWSVQEELMQIIMVSLLVNIELLDNFQFKMVK